MDEVFVDCQGALEIVKRGEILILVDDMDRENEGDFVVAGEQITPDKINFMTKYGRGLVCLAMDSKTARRLELTPMVSDITAPFGTAFTVSIDAKEGITTGISAYDRALTVKKAVDESSRPEDFVRPGHIFPIVARDGGVLMRAGHTEGAKDLCRLAGLKPVAVICEIMRDDGHMARLPDLIEFARKFNLKITSIEEIIRFRLRSECFVKKVAEARLPTKFGEFKAQVWENIIDGSHNFAIVMGKIKTDEPILVRVHSECLTGDVFESLRCDCGAQLRKAMKLIGEEGRGVLVYMKKDIKSVHEGRGIGLAHKVKAYNLQDEGLDTVEANEKLGFPPDLRDYGIGAQILRSIGVGKMKLMTNNPKKVVGLSGYGLSIEEIVSLQVKPNNENIKYLRTKKEKLGHFIVLNKNNS